MAANSPDEPPAGRAELARDVWKRLFDFLISTAS
jgi:hypothetical protein